MHATRGRDARSFTRCWLVGFQATVATHKRDMTAVKQHVAAAEAEVATLQSKLEAKTEDFRYDDVP